MKKDILSYVLFLIVVSALNFSAAYGEPTMIGSDKQLFIDFSLVASHTNMELVMNPPVKCGKAFEADKPWEYGYIGGLSTVIDDDGLCRMWYRAADKEWLPKDPDNKVQAVCCYATSRDGINWEKPIVGVHEFRGSKENNIVFPFEHVYAIFKDPVAPSGQHYKVMIYNDTDVNCYAGYSPDGIYDWTILDWRMDYLCDSHNMGFWDDQREKYVLYFRGFTRDLLRTVVRLETDDFLELWPVPEPTPNTLKKHKELYPTFTNELPVMFQSDERDPHPSDFYTPSVEKYPGAPNVYFAFPSMFFHLPEPPMEVEHSEDEFYYSYATEPPYIHHPKHYDAPASPAMERRNVTTRNSGFLDIRLCTSRDGIHWNRDHREPYVSLGSEGEPDNGSNYMMLGMVIRGGRIFQYYTGYSNWHGGDDEQPPAIIRLEQRLDGFVSADAAYEGGKMITKPIIFSGSELHLNINTSAIGSAAVGILDEDGNPFPGYDIPDCDVIRGNFIDKTVSWHDSSDVSALAGKAVRLRFLMRGSKLFSFRFK